MPDELDARIHEALRAEVAALPFTLTSVMIEERLERRPGLLRFAVAGVAAVGLLLAAALVATLIARPSNVGPPTPASATPIPTASGAAEAGLNISWQQVPLDTGTGPLGGYVLFDGQQFLSFGSTEQPGAAYTSADGRSWQLAPDGRGDIWPPQPAPAAWNGTVLTWNIGAGGSLVHVWRPDGSSTSHYFASASVDGVAIGPRGMVVLTSSGFDATGQLLDPSAEGGWFSETGETWTEMSTAPRSTGGLKAAEAVAAGPDGFFARTFDGVLWGSDNGLDWVAVTAVGAGGGDLLPWRDGVLSMDINTPSYEYWTAAGREVLPVPSDWSLNGSFTAADGAGPMGIFTVDPATGLVRFSPDGQRWAQATLPPRHWVTGDQNVFADPSMAIGTNAVLLLLWEWAPDGTEVQSLWRGTLEP